MTFTDSTPSEAKAAHSWIFRGGEFSTGDMRNLHPALTLLSVKALKAKREVAQGPSNPNGVPI
jgi:hypothetical protein